MNPFIKLLKEHLHEDAVTANHFIEHAENARVFNKTDSNAYVKLVGLCKKNESLKGKVLLSIVSMHMTRIAYNESQKMGRDKRNEDLTREKVVEKKMTASIEKKSNAFD